MIVSDSKGNINVLWLDSPPNLLSGMLQRYTWLTAFCNSHARFMTNEARLKINLSQMRNDMWSYKGLDQWTDNTSAASIKLSCRFFMTSWTEFKNKGNRPYLMAAKISNRTCMDVMGKMKAFSYWLVMTIWYIRGYHVADCSPDADAAKYFIQLKPSTWKK